ncbi:MAG TPA: DUF4238 domain-containing protein [Thermoanaerobaculia bacterium]|jgi:hypothetical protein|nr:DUF4238 domain-containing protein [Thermoanaerobaculia bacterium]
MAGNRQHIIPRFLQAGFASRKDQDDVFTWVYRVGQVPFECNTLNVGVEREFYTIGADTAADDAITDAEGPFNRLVNSLREAQPQRVSQPQIADLIAHFEIRTRHLRLAFSSATDYLLRALAAFLADTHAATEYFTRKARTDPALLRKPLADALGWPQDVVDWFVATAPPEIFNEAFAPWLPLLSDMIQNRLRGELPAIMKKSHIRALKSTVSPVARADALRNLAYATVAHPSGDLILGDSIVLFEVTGSRPYKKLLEGSDELKAVYLPLSPRLVLVGATDPNWGVPSNLPDAIARCSFEYFISDRVTSTHELRQARIGETAALLSNDELDDIVNSSLSD